MLDRLCIGTANWGRDYNGHNVFEKEQNLIMEYMKEIGIEWLDVAEAYETMNVGKEFKRIIKTNHGQFWHHDDIYLAHKLKDYDPDFHNGVSIDELVLGHGCTMKAVELPFSILNRNKKLLVGVLQQIPVNGTVCVRSIFCKGKALKYFTPQQCIDFCLMQQWIDKVIIGIDSVDQLKENVAHLVKMEKFEHNEEVDTRKF